eukprot:Filipodium_phascolosomae@DN2547_c0_g1_i2.p1
MCSIRPSSFSPLFRNWLMLERSKEGPPPEGWSEWISSWKFQNKEDCPQQCNMSDCGVFVCFFAEMVAADGHFSEYTIHTEGRRRLTSALLTLNRFCEDLDDEDHFPEDDVIVAEPRGVECAHFDIEILDENDEVVEAIQASVPSAVKGVASSEISVQNIITEPRGRSRMALSGPDHSQVPRRKRNRSTTTAIQRKQEQHLYIIE